MATRRYRDYAVRFHENIFPLNKRQRLSEAAVHLSDFDLIGLQECDAGSFRTGFVHQGEILGEEANFSYRAFHTSRRMALAKSGLAILSRYPLNHIEGHRLPSRIPGRGALSARVETPSGTIRILVVHLSLGRRDRLNQMNWIHAWLASQVGPAVVMGDFNVGAGSVSIDGLRRAMSDDSFSPVSFPSWNPRRSLDHIFTFGLEALPAISKNLGISDHLALVRSVGFRPCVALPGSPVFAHCGKDD